MGELTPVGDDEDGFDVEVLWQRLPSRSKRTFLHCIQPHAHLKHIPLRNSQAWPGIWMVVMLLCEQLAESQIGCDSWHEPTKFMWNLWECRDVINILAADFLSKSKEVECLFLICYGAAVDECLARGTKALLKWIHNRPATIKNQMMTSTFLCEDLLLIFGFLQRALLACKTRNGMLAYTIERLEETIGRDEICLTLEEKMSIDEHTDYLVKKLRAPDRDVTSRGDMHSIELPSNPTPPPPIKFIFLCSVGTFDFHLYKDTELDWLFRLCAARTWNEYYLFHCYKDGIGNLCQPDFGNLNIVFRAYTVDYNFELDYEKTLGELGYKEGIRENIYSQDSVPSMKAEHHDVLFHWEQLPVGVKELIHRDLLLIISRQNEPRTLSFESLSIFAAQSLNYLRVTSNHNAPCHLEFNLMQAILSSYWLAGHYTVEWGHVNFGKAIRLVIHATVLEEWLALGSNCVKLARLDELSNSRLSVDCNSQNLFAHCMVVLNSVTTRHAMVQTIIQKLDTMVLAADWYMKDCKMDQQGSIRNLTDQLTKLIHWSTDSVCLSATGFPTSPTHILYLSLLHHGMRLEVAVFRHTSARWLFVLCLAMVTGDFKLLKDSRSGLRHLHCPIIRNTATGTNHYVTTSGKTTLAELGFAEDDIISIEYSLVNKAEAKPKRPKAKRAPPPSGLWRSKRAKAPPAPSQPSEGDCRRAHSEALEPVLHELRPVLKLIRSRHNAVLIKRESPKKTKRQPIRQFSTVQDMPSAVPLSSRVGKSRYPVLVGEPDNLYKTSKTLRLAAPSADMTLDLHGLSRPEALDLLRCRLAIWTERAMMSKYPFVVAADIVCGRGTQGLSELVADFIRDNPQIANRRKGIAA